MARRVVKPRDIVRDPNTIIVEESDVFNAKLYQNLYIPSYVHGYSLAIEYMKDWFLKGLPDVNFKYVHVNGKHMFDDYKQFNAQNVKREKPLLIITPQVDHDYDREGLDNYLMPNDMYVQKNCIMNAFFQDRDRNMFLTLQMKALKMRFTFVVRVATRAQQLDVKEKMAFAYRVGATQGEYRVVDYVVSKDIINNIAHDAGFEVREYKRCTKDSIYNQGITYYEDTGNGYAILPIKNKEEFQSKLPYGVYVKCKPEIVEPTKFLEYLNKNSAIPFTFKMRDIKNEPEYYIRMDNIYCHIAVRDKISVDDGEREGQNENNFNITLEAELDIPVPWYFVYYQTSPLRYNITTRDTTTTAGFYTICQMQIPDKNEFGWRPLINTSCHTDPNEGVIDCKPLFYNTRLMKAISYALEENISPRAFCSPRVFEDFAGEIRIVPSTFNYDTLSLTIDPMREERMLYLAFYVDTDYMANILNMAEYKEGRI